MNRRTFLTASAALMSAACGGSSESDAAPGPGAQRPNPMEPAGAAPAPAPAGGTQATPASAQRSALALTLHPKRSGTMPYLAAVYPLEGAVPSGESLTSGEDASLASSVLSRWPDGSAAVVVVSGELDLTAGTPKTVSLRAQSGSTAAPLTAARVAALVRNITVNAGALGTATLSNFASPERVWWANARTICCRYRAALDATLEAVIDIHAFASDRALVEVVVENGKIDASAASPVRPATKSYSGATVTVNGETVATVSSPTSGQSYRGGRGGGRYAGGHEAFRAWYCSTWIGGDPAVEVTHNVESLQAHPLFFRCWRAAKTDFRSTYESDAYAPWSAGRLNVPGMPGTGDIEGIGPLTQWDSRYLQTASPYVRRAVIASALSALSCNLSYRDGASGRVPTHDQSSGHNQDDGSWPRTASEPSWEMAHHPAIGLMAFLCQPSPVFIEIAQKIALWNATSRFKDGVFGFWAQVRGKAWGLRSLAHAIFLTPDADPWKAPARKSLAANVALINRFRTSPNATLGFLWDPAPDKCADLERRNEGMQQALWMHHWVLMTLHSAERAKLLGGTEQALLTTVADWAALQPVRYVNEARNGEWRLHNYLTTVGRATVTETTGDNLGSGVYAGRTFDALPTYPENLAWYYRDSPPPDAGKFLFIETNPASNPNYRMWSSARESNSAGVGYAAIFWAALTAAVERGVPGADAAWTRVTTGVTNLEAWADSFADEPRYNRYPRNR